MNPLIIGHFDAIEAHLISSPVIVNYDLVRREVTSTDGKIRLRATLIEGGLLELFEYVVEKRGQLSPEKYRFHWDVLAVVAEIEEGTQ